jgi:hypothetical protein
VTLDHLRRALAAWDGDALSSGEHRARDSDVTWADVVALGSYLRDDRRRDLLSVVGSEPRAGAEAGPSDDDGQHLVAQVRAAIILFP